VLNSLLSGTVTAGTSEHADSGPKAVFFIHIRDNLGQKTTYLKQKEVLKNTYFTTHTLYEGMRSNFE
jgi:hypothetical protein